MKRHDIYVALKRQIGKFQTEFESTKVDTYPFDEFRVKFKRCGDCILALYIPNSFKTNESRSIDGDWNFAKFRAEKAWCICILDTIDGTLLMKYDHVYYGAVQSHVAITYISNAFVVPDGFDMDLETVCGQGIHYFNHWIAAYFYERCCCMTNSVEFSEDGKILYFYERNDQVAQRGPDTARLLRLIQEAESTLNPSF